MKTFKATVTIETITPEQATLYLEDRMERQRHVRETWVKRLAIALAQRTFRLSPDAIVLVKGQLANGQHRLQAVMESKIAANFIVMRTEDEEIFGVTDRGRSRSMGDIAKILGVKNANHVSAAVSLYFLHKNGLLWLTGGRSSVINDAEQIQYIRENLDALEALAEEIGPVVSNSKYVSAGRAFALCIEARDIGKYEKAVAFMRELCGLESPSPIVLKLQGRLVDNRVSKSKLPRAYIYGLMIKTFGFYVSGKKCETLRLGAQESFPSLGPVIEI